MNFSLSIRIECENKFDFENNRYEKNIFGNKKKTHNTLIVQSSAVETQIV